MLVVALAAAIGRAVHVVAQRGGALHHGVLPGPMPAVLVCCLSSTQRLHAAPIRLGYGLRNKIEHQWVPASAKAHDRLMSTTYQKTF